MLFRTEGRDSLTCLSPVYVSPYSERGTASLLRHRIMEARLRRQSINLPNDQTTCYRLINGEGDRLSGLVVDVYGSLAVVASSARWVRI